MELNTSAVKTLEGAFYMFGKDLEMLPEEAFTQKFGDKVRTVADIVHEVNLVNDHIGMALRGEEQFDWPEGWITAPAELNSKAAVIEAFKKSSAKIVETAKSFSEAQMEETVETEHGPSTRFARCQFMALHTWYHSGQLNYIQTMLGDDGWHW